LDEDESETARSTHAHSGARESLPRNDPADVTEEVERIRAMPKEVGVLLVVAGIGGLLLPGPVGSPFLVLGGVILWPRAFSRVETFLERKCPRLHRRSVRQMRRFLDDLEARYPTPR
jgi:hypothetical protein